MMDKREKVRVALAKMEEGQRLMDGGRAEDVARWQWLFLEAYALLISAGAKNLPEPPPGVFGD
jgi:hypothetical protein